MNYGNLKNLDALKKVIKNLTVFCAVIFTSAIIFYSPNISSQTSALPSCDSLPDSTTAIPSRNCLFFGKKLCTAVPGIEPTNPSDIVGVLNAKHRENCYNLSDLPLCSQLNSSGGTTPKPNKNCVRECSDSSFVCTAGQIRGIDCAVHNRDCVRFADGPEAGLQTKAQADAEPNPAKRFYITPDPSNPKNTTSAEQFSTSRKCHQVADSVDPAPHATTPNCELLKCNFLTLDELDEPRVAVGDENLSKEYCDGNVKCYEFGIKELDYARVRSKNTMCKIHDCKPTSAACGSDDTQPIKNKYSDPAEKGKYIQKYQERIYFGFELSDQSLCNKITCKPVMKRQFRCLPFTDATPTQRNTGNPGDPLSGCNEAGVCRSGVCSNDPSVSCTNDDGCKGGSVCDNGYCYRSIDCNSAANAKEPECMEPSAPNQSGDDTDPIDSWFYRPRPLDDAMKDGHLREMTEDKSYEGRANEHKRYCYNRDQLESNGWLDVVPYDLTWLGLGKYTHDFHDYMTKATRSPGLCNGTQMGSRGNGYPYLCGNHGSLYKDIDSDSAYYRGYVRSNFTEGDATHTITLCMRFSNWMAPQRTCGKRQCGITCSFNCNAGGSQVCGRDECHDITISESTAQDCMMNQENFEGTPDKIDNKCAVVIDTYLRMRAVKYQNRICSFIDLKGTLAYDADYLDGTEKLNDGKTCISGSANKDGKCEGGKNTNDSKGGATFWRTIKMHGDAIKIPYIQNNRPEGQPRGYINKSGQLFEELECPKVPLRIAPPRIYNVATSSNSPKMFTPPLYILNTMTKKGSNVVSRPDGNTKEQLGDTDFHEPAIEVRFGTAHPVIGLDFGVTQSPPTEIKTTINDLNYSITVFVKKQFNESSKKPMLCLYKKIVDKDGIVLDPIRIQCVNAIFPEINNPTSKRRVRIYAAPESATVIVPGSNPPTEIALPKYRGTKLTLRYVDYGANGIDNSCTGDDKCSKEIKFYNPDPDKETCTDSSNSEENYKICAKRDECTKLNIECIKNEIDMQTAKIAGEPLDTFLAVRKNCNETLLPFCNRLKGLNTIAGSTVTNMNDAGSHPTAYGWFNEICITKGFETKLKRILALKYPGGMGKCRIDNTKKTPGANCNAGGKKPDCPCQEYVDGYDTAADEEMRLETPHEAGLCVDIPLPKTCAPIDYNPNQNPDQDDPEYVSSSLGNSSYSSGYSSNQSDITNLVHLSHKFRSEGNASNPSILLRGHAEFPVGIMGMSDIDGECKGFWRPRTSESGLRVSPRISCDSDEREINASWNSSVRNPCVRYSCPGIQTTGPNEIGIYQGDYGLNEEGENKGKSNGFATWDGLTKTTDFPEQRISGSCIAGFKLPNANAVVEGGKITRYDGGTNLVRSCDQLGNWSPPSGACERITCPPIDPPKPTSSTDTAAWRLWNNDNAGGARFGVSVDSEGRYAPKLNKKGEVICNPTKTEKREMINGVDTITQQESGPCTTPIPASRSSVRVQPESIAIGTCVNSLGFFQVPGGSPPSRECDHLGNWGRVKNPCVTRCKAIVDPDANDPSNGFAKWNEVQGIEIGQAKDGEFAGCSTVANSDGTLIPYPYPPLRKKDGTFYTLTSGAQSADTIPFDVTKDSRAAGNPERVCMPVSIAGGGGAIANVWSAPSSSCTNKCPGADVDPRIGAGRTQHPKALNAPARSVIFKIGIRTTTGIVDQTLGTYALPAGQILVDWTSTKFGEWDFKSNPALDLQSLSDYDGVKGKTNGYYILARKCNPNTKKWDPPIVQCSKAGDGSSIQDSNAVFTNIPQGATTPPNSNLSVSEGAGAIVGTCKSGYGYSKISGTPNPSTAPRYECKALNNTRNIDEFRFEKVGGESCQKYCSVNYGDTFGTANVYLGGNLPYVDVGTTISLGCATGYGQAVSGGARTTKDSASVPYACDAPIWARNDGSWWNPIYINSVTTDRITSLPSIRCNENGWSGVTNSCSSCRNCASVTGGNDVSVYATGYEGECPYATFYASEFGASGSMDHNTDSETCKYWIDKSSCGSGYSYFLHANLYRRCRDGFIYHSFSSAGPDACDGTLREWTHAASNNHPYSACLNPY